MAIDSKEKKDINSFIEKFKKGRGLLDSSRVKIGFMSDDETIGKIDHLPTGIIGIDTLTDGGIIKGKINQISGAAGCGKSTMILRTIGNIQQRDETFLANYQNSEQTLDRDYAIFNGIDPARFLVGEFATNEQVADFCNYITDPESHISLSAFDTIQALSCEGELYKGKKDDAEASDDGRKEKSVSDNTMALAISALL
jgi:RecA/RadA recombinase